MTEFSKGIVKALENIAGTSLGRATIYTMGHIVIAMVCNRLITGASWLVVGRNGRHHRTFGEWCMVLFFR